MSNRILIRAARQLLTLHGAPGPRRATGLRNLNIIENGSVLVVDGQIATVGPTRRVENLREAQGAREIDATGRVVMPAFVDAHTELMRDCASAANLRKADANAHRVLDGCIRHGTVSVDARFGCGVNEATDLRMLRAAVSLNSDRATVVPVYAAPAVEFGAEKRSAAQQLSWFDEALFPRFHARDLARYASVRCGPDGFSLDDTRRYMEICGRHGLTVKLEITDPGVDESIGLAVERGAAVIEGLHEVDEDGLSTLRSSPIIVTLVPALAAGTSASRTAARAFIDAGVPVALGSGFRFHQTSTFSMQMAVAIACAQLNMLVEEAIVAATINSAYAVGLGDKTGSLQFGKDADIVILNVPDYRDIARHFGVNLVAFTMKKGVCVYREPPVVNGES